MGISGNRDARRGHHAAAALLAAAALALPAGPALADTPQVRITPDRELDFGTFMVFGTGGRKVGATGLVTDYSIAALEGRTPAPARFTVTYDRGNESRNVIDVELEVVMSTPPNVRDGGVDGSLSMFETDLPGSLNIAPGQAIRLTLANCRTRVCSTSFQVGARIDVTRNYGGAQLVIPLPMDVTVISAERQPR